MLSPKHIVYLLKRYLRMQLGSSVKDVILFGSQQKGNSYQHSDYDILIILEKPVNNIDETRILDLCYDVDLKFNIILDVHILAQPEINTLRGKQPVYQNAIKSGYYA
jgi:predicted nucleotidyltransferase